MTNDRLLTADDLAERWGVSPQTAWDRAKTNLKGVWLGRGKYDPARLGPKTVRFRLETVLAWESRQEISLTARPAEPAPATRPPTPAGAIPGWDGVKRLRRKNPK